MRKALYSLLMFAFLFLALAGSVSAESCSPSGGYDYCYQWSNTESYGSARATSTVQVQGTNLQGTYKSGYYVGPTWIGYKITADNGYLYLNKNSWDDVFNTARCDDNDGKSCKNYDKQLQSEGKYYLTQNQGDSFSGCSAFIGTDYDYDEASNGDWAWSYTYGGWGWVGSSCLNVKQVECVADSDCGSNQFCNKAGEWSTWSCESRVCTEGEERCFGSNLQRCEGNSWADKGTLINKCGVECISDSDCPADEVSDSFCSGSNILQTTKDYSCANYACLSSTSDNILQSCSYLCQDVEGEGAICIDKICDAGEKMCSESGNVLVCQNNEWVSGEECSYGCEDGKCTEFTSTNNFYLILGGIGFVFILIIVILIVIVSRRSKGRKKRR